jgi:hypothetical protein
MNFDSVQDMFDALAAPFPPEEIMWRVGPTNEKSRNQDQPLRGQPLCYIDARAVMDRLDSVCGPEGWQDTYTPGVATSIVCNIGIKIADEWIWKGDGAGATDMEADKGALSDAFKRAGVRWGIGRYLYEIKSPWLVLEKRGTTAIINDEQKAALAKLYEEAARKIQPVIGVHAYRQAYRLLIGTIGTIPVEQVKSYADTNKTIIADLPAAMRDHVLSTINRRIGSQAA